MEFDTALIDKLGLTIAAIVVTITIFYVLVVAVLIFRGNKLSKYLSTVRAKLVANAIAAFGLPLCAFGAFALVFVFHVRFGAPTADGVTEIEFFGLSFSGPSGPATLWVICYLALVLSIRMVQNLKDNPSIEDHSASPSDSRESQGDEETG